ncbi:AAA family ATPase [Trichloromonas sp.]|uniref:AAA family ATPase n=1 Tax=Trichloromonas sp. TaxID=3069249 RepID=UPI001D265B7C|nr:AAA family ATPase [Desulfuromonadaceae bacterium]MDY0269082.1 MoxR family ATPase [Trichloromonas sp.]
MKNPTHPSLTHLFSAPEPLATTYSVQEIFGFASQMPLPGFKPGHPLVPQALETYVWSPELAKDCIEWLCDPEPEPLWVSGPTGCGKTEALKQLFAKLHMPTVIVSAKKSTEPDDILGRVQLVNGNTVFTPGPLLEAYARGYALLFDEIDGYNPEVMMACHRLLEKAPVTLDDGTVITPANRILMAATANTRGDGQGGDIYAATSVFNLATLNRFEKWSLDYPAAKIEEQILSGALPQLDEKVISAMVKVAADIRTSYRQGSCPGPISIRDLKRWGRKLLLGAQRTDVPVVYHAFDKAFGHGVDEHVRAMLHKLIQTHFNIPAPELAPPAGDPS